MKKILILSVKLCCVICLMGLSTQLQAQSEQAYDALLKDAVSADGPGMTALVMKDGKVLYRGAAGMANIELGVQMQPDHVFRLGSITKQFTTVAILMLMEEGKLSLQDPITKFFPEYPTQGNTITVEHLLTHTSGIRSYTGMESFWKRVREDFSPQEMMEFFQDEAMDFKPGEEIRYNNSGFFLLGAIIEKLSSQTYAEFIKQKIFDPLGMEHSYYGSHNKIIPHRVPGYQQDGTVLRNADFMSMTAPYAAGSLLSNVDDLSKWDQALHSGKLVSKSNLEKAWTSYKLNNGKETGYGYGWSLSGIDGKKSVEHGGGIFGFVTYALSVPEENLYVAVLSNCDFRDPAELAIEMAARSLGISYHWTPIVVEEATLAEYTGIYRHEEDQHKIFVQDGKLYTTWNEENRFELEPIGPDKFHLNPGYSVVQFERDAAGKLRAAVQSRRSGKITSFGLTKEKIETETAIELPESVLSRYVGEYDMEGLGLLTIFMEEGHLFGQPEGSPKAELFPTSETEFFLKIAPIKVAFKVDKSGKATGILMKQGDQKMKGTKRE